MVNGDVPEGAAGGSAAGGSGNDEAAWLDLVARFGASEPRAGDDSAVPWPEREDLPRPADRPPPADRTGAGDPDDHAGPVRVNPPSPADQQRVIAGAGPRDYAPAPDPDNDHYVPPPPPPLPKLDPVAKGAWLALFGGPLYLLIATAAGWTVSGLAAFLSVGAFIGGFAVLVFRMDGGGPRDSGPDDGAVV